MIKATATQPTPTLYAKLQDGTVRVDTFEVPAGRVCSAITGRRDFCIDNLSQSLGQGLVNTLGQYMKPGTKDKSDYTVEFRMLGFQQTPSQREAKAVQLSMRWKFTLKRVTGEQVIAIDETTVGPQEVVRSDLANNALMLLVNHIFERIGAELSKVDLSGKPPAPPPEPEDAGAAADAGPVQVCVPNSTQECVGAGACKGGQSCLPDGSGFTECDCGKKKKKSGGSSAGAAAPAPAPAAPAEPPP